MNVIESYALSKSYGRYLALNSLTFHIEENKITGLIGRNGAGKTTLLKLIAGFLKTSSGELRVFEEDPFNSLKVSSNLIFIDDNMTIPSTLTLAEALELAANFYPHWDMHLAQGLFKYFSLRPEQYHNDLSKGMRSTFNMIIGLSARCALTIFDEPTTGMDAAVRKDFYRALLKDYIAFPRTIILSSHLLQEIEDMLEDILLIKDGHILLHQSVEEMKEYALGLTGKKSLLQELTQGQDIYHRNHVGTDTAYYVVKNNLSTAKLEQCRRAGVQISPVATDDVCVYLTNKRQGGIDDVFNRS